jgi:hypothetical protein
MGMQTFDVREMKTRPGLTKQLPTSFRESKKPGGLPVKPISLPFLTNL